jgi:hypothetical protein
VHYLITESIKQSISQCFKRCSVIHGHFEIAVFDISTENWISSPWLLYSATKEDSNAVKEFLFQWMEYAKEASEVNQDAIYRQDLLGAQFRTCSIIVGIKDIKEVGPFCFLAAVFVDPGSTLPPREQSKNWLRFLTVAMMAGIIDGLVESGQPGFEPGSE